MGKVLIADASQELCSSIAQVLGEMYDITLCHDLSSTRQAILDFAPDALVFGLHSMDELSFLEELDSSKRPALVVYTEYCSSFMQQHLLRLCDCLMFTPCDLALLSLRLEQLMNQDTSLERDEEISAAILRQLLYRPARDGYRYLIAALVLYNRNRNQAITKELYPALAKQFNTNVPCIEKSIRCVIQQAWAQRDDAVWRRYFPVDRNGQVIRPTNKAFLTIVVEQLSSYKRKFA